MATIPGALLLVISSPHARRGEAYETFKHWFGIEGADVLVWRATTREMNPSVPQEFIDHKYAKDEASARSEYGAEWRDDILTFLDRAQIEALVDEGVAQRPFQSRYRYFAHCDPFWWPWRFDDVGDRPSGGRARHPGLPAGAAAPVRS